MKLFQIEEPEGAPLSADGPGVSVGIDLADESAAVAIALGGNAEILPGSDGERRLNRTGDDTLATLLLALRARAEKQLARPVTHAVIAIAEDNVDEALDEAATEAGLTVLKIIPREGTGDAPALRAAQLAEDLAPQA